MDDKDLKALLKTGEALAQRVTNVQGWLARQSTDEEWFHKIVNILTPPGGKPTTRLLDEWKFISEVYTDI